MDDDHDPNEDDQEQVIYLDELEEVTIDQLVDDIDINLEESEEQDPSQPEVIDLACLTFQKHKQSVFSSDLSNDGQFAITGGEDDTAYLWNTENGEVVLECTGHKDSVTEVCFNFDNQYVATGDMLGMIQVWDVNEKKLVWCYDGDDMEWLFWHSLTNALICGNRSGDVYVWQIPQGNCKVLPAYTLSPALCGKMLPNGKQILVGYENGHLKLWNIKECKCVWTSTDFATIFNIDINNEGTLAIVAPGSSIVKLADGKTLSTLLAKGEREVEAILFNKDLGSVATGSISGKLCVWEVGRYVLRHEANIECAVTIMKWGSNEKIFIGATDGAVYVCDVRTGTLLEKLTGHKSEILSISVFNNCSKILTTSDDGTAKIFNIKND